MLTLKKSTSTAPKSHRVLSYQEEKFLDERRKQLETDIKRGELQQGVNFEPKELQNLQKRLDELKAMKSKFGAREFAGNERVAAEKEIKLIEMRLAQKWGGRIPTFVEYWQRPKEGGVHYQRLVDKIAELNADPEYAELIRRWKFLKRGMNPADKRIASVLNLFKH